MMQRRRFSRLTLVLGSRILISRAALRSGVRIVRPIARTIVRQPAALRLGLARYDADGSGVWTFAGCNLSLSMIHAIHFRDGPMPVQLTPHFRYFRELLAQEGVSSETKAGEIEYVGYQAAQHGYSRPKLEARLRQNRLLVEAYLAGARFTVLAKPGPRGTWILLDGFHRTALVLAAGMEDFIAARIIARQA